MALSLLQDLKPKPDAARARESCRRLAAGYERTRARIEPLRLHAVREPALRPGETVFDIACGTGATLPMLAAAVGSSGTTVGVELSPEMVEQAQRRINALNCGERLRLDCRAVEDFRPPAFHHAPSPLPKLKGTPMSHRTTAAALALTLAFAAPLARAAGSHAGGHDESAIGEPGKAAKVNRTVQIDMTDAMRFSPSNIDAKQGETIRFVIKNSGKVKHELVLGTEKDLKEHAEVMKKNPEMEHDDPSMVTVAPGKSGEVIWHFTKSGKVDFACLQPGHYDAGMKGLVKVTAGKAAPKGDGHGGHKH